VGQTLVLIGLVIVAIGGLIWAGVPLGRLPGDIVYRRDGFTLYFPITTMILVSLALTVIGMFFRR
jgi:formate hydrogenlyase subunit 3/multisubunit Na+/H+ antiporter MnhD subunit